MNTPDILIAGIGNIFLGDDAFGVEVVRELVQRQWPPEVCVVDFGIRGFDLACALAGDYDAAILVDAAQRGGPPGTLYVIEPDVAGFAYDDFRRAAELVHAGEVAMRQALPQVRKCLEKPAETTALAKTLPAVPTPAPMPAD